MQTAITETTLRRGRLGLVEAVRQNRHARSNENLLVVVDQFEELFRFERVSASEQYSRRGRGLRQAAARSRAPARAEHLRRADDALRLPRRLLAVLGLARGDQRRPVSDPAHDARRARRGHHRPGRRRRRRASRSASSTDCSTTWATIPTNLPILQHALMRTWDHWAADHAARRAGRPAPLRGRRHDVGRALAPRRRSLQRAAGRAQQTDRREALQGADREGRGQPRDPPPDGARRDLRADGRDASRRSSRSSKSSAARAARS